ncbi:MAG: cold shock and DUF1294 domain-containing protein [Pseudomonadales bacterium]
MSKRNAGRIVNWKDDRGFGFIRPSDGSSDVFVHISAFATRSRRPTENEAVTYAVRTDGNGRAQARQVRFFGANPNPTASNNGPMLLALLAAVTFLVGVGALAISGRVPPILLTIYITASVVSFIIYAWDKSSARNERWRTPERTLHLLGLAGGWPGGLIARQVFRHKSRKQSFIVTFWTTVAINCGVLALLISSAGRWFG